MNVDHGGSLSFSIDIVKFNNNEPLRPRDGTNKLMEMDTIYFKKVT